MSYSKLDATLKGVKLTIVNYRTRHSPKDVEVVDVGNIEPGSTILVDIKSKSFHYNNKILLVEAITGTDDTIVVYTDSGHTYVYRHDDQNTHPLSRFLIVRSKVFLIWLSRRNLWLGYICCVFNKYNLPIKKTYFTIGNEIKRRKNTPVFTKNLNPIRLLQKGLFIDRISVKDLLEGEPQINASIGLTIILDDNDTRAAHHFLTRGTKRYTNRTKWYYAPITQTRRDGFSISIRRNGHAGLSVVRRRLEGVERALLFRFYELIPVSFTLYYLAHMVRRLSRTKVNLYFEKLANQAEEGVIDIFRKARDNSNISKNYFIIRDTADVYKSIKHEKGVVRNFTLRSYWLMYRANHIIASEVPQHMNILRSGNRYARRAPYSQIFVFLQHGITYLKPQDKTTSFKKGREGEPDYMVVNSEKERDVTSDMLNIEEERFINSGMPIFDTIKYGHITRKSPDIVTIMLTWKPYEEHIQDFSESTYYKTTVHLYKALNKLIDKDNIRIIAHPKFKNHMLGTDIEEVLWRGSIADALEQTKLVITDYSSVCYNVFYQGGGVIFYQPDLDHYQRATGKLIPHDDEYIGERAFSKNDLDKLLGSAFRNGAVDLSLLRTKRFVNNYQSINEYADGSNIQRIYEALSNKNMV